MIKTKMFTDYDNDSVDKQINTWLSKHQDYIVVDVKLQSHLLKNDEYSSYIVREALVIYREYENV